MEKTCSRNNDYKIAKRDDGWWNVFYKNKKIAITIDEEQARVAIFKHNSQKEFANEKDFKK